VCWRATAKIVDLIIAGNDRHFATTSANAGSIAALFAAPLAESLDFSVESAIVRSLSWVEGSAYASNASRKTENAPLSRLIQASNTIGATQSHKSKT
jgi:hypothetical protein